MRSFGSGEKFIVSFFVRRDVSLTSRLNHSKRRDEIKIYFVNRFSEDSVSQSYAN